MKTKHKAISTRVSGNLLVLIAVCLGLDAIALPESGPRPDSWLSPVACILAAIPTFLLGVWLRRRGLQLKEQSEMESCIQELDAFNPDNHEEASKD